MSKHGLQFLSLWSINDELNLISLKNQLDELKVCGLEGVVFHPRYYPGNPEYLSPQFFDIVSDLILYAQSIGMAFWIYDENGWPSGTAGGKVLLENPNLVCQWLSYQHNEEGGQVLQSGCHENNSYNIVLKQKKAVSSLDIEATRLFVKFTHEAYKQHLHPDAFAYVTGFFSDEVGFLDGHSVAFREGAVPWHPRVGELYAEKYGEDVLEQAHLLFVDGPNAGIIRIRYWETVTEVLKEAYYEEINSWCEQNGKLLTAHLKGEEHPFFQLSYSGSMFQILQAVNAPAIDALERFPGNHFYPRALHSIAVQQGRSISLVEAMGGAGWGVTPESFSNYIMWLAGHGTNTFVLHLNQLKLSMQACHDWPPSIPSHLSWKQAFASVLEDIKKKAEELPDLRQQDPELLIVTPTRGITAHFHPNEAQLFNEHDGSGIPLTTKSTQINHQFMSLVEMLFNCGIHYEFTEEKGLEQAVLENGIIRLGQRDYHRILFPEGVELEFGQNRDIKKRCLNAGVEVITEKDIELEYTKKKSEYRNITVSDQSRIDNHMLLTQSDWQSGPAEANTLLLELEQVADEKVLLASFEVKGNLNKSLELRLLDPALEVRINSRMLKASDANGLRYNIPVNDLPEHNIVHITPASWPSELNSIAFIEGNGFLVRSKCEFTLLQQDKRQIMTRGPFYLESGESFDCERIVESGFPYYSGKITVSKTMHITEQIKSVCLSFGQVQADAALVRLDGEVAGWIWGPHWELEIPQLDAGEHLLQLELIPSTYNTYGPHRHYEGDRHLISPAQYAGRKNFADHRYAPENTFVEKWHFVRCGASGKVSIKLKGLAN